MRSHGEGREPVLVYMRMPEYVRKELPDWIKEGERPVTNAGKEKARKRYERDILESAGQVSVVSLIDDLGKHGIHLARDGIVVRPWYKPREFRLELPFRHIEPRPLWLPSNLMHDIEHLFLHLSWAVKSGRKSREDQVPEHRYVSLTRPTLGEVPRTSLRFRAGDFVLEDLGPAGAV